MGNYRWIGFYAWGGGGWDDGYCLIEVFFFFFNMNKNENENENER